MRTFQGVSAGMMPQLGPQLKLSPIPDAGVWIRAVSHIGESVGDVSCHVVIMWRSLPCACCESADGQRAEVVQSNGRPAALPAPGLPGLAGGARPREWLHSRAGFALKWVDENEKCVTGAITGCSSHPRTPI